MPNWFRYITEALRSIQTWVALVFSIPSIWAAFDAYTRGVYPFEIIFIASFVLAFSMFAAYYIVRLFVFSFSFLSTRKEQERIAKQIKEYAESGYSKIDAPTAAAIWANSRQDGDLIRHLKFRVIKAAIRKGEIKNTVQKAGTGKGPNRFTAIPVEELKAYFFRTGVIREES